MRHEEKVEAFVEAYIKTKDEFEAAKAVTESQKDAVIKKTAYQMMNDPDVKKAIKDAKAGMGKRELLEDLTTEYKNATSVTDKLKIAKQIENLMKLQVGSEASDWENQYLNLGALGNVLSDFIDGKTEEFEKIFNPTLDANGKVRFNVSKKNSREQRLLQMLTLLKTLHQQRALM